MEARPRELLIFELESGRKPFSDWMDTLIDNPIYETILVRLERVEDGNFGDCEPVGSGIHELRINVGPGYRVYFGEDGDFVILLCGGKKKTQERDINAARKLWDEYNA